MGITIFKIFIWESRYIVGYTVGKIQLSPKCFVSSNLYFNSYFDILLSICHIILHTNRFVTLIKWFIFIRNKGVGTASQRNSKCTDAYHSNN